MQLKRINLTALVSALLFVALVVGLALAPVFARAEESSTTEATASTASADPAATASTASTASAASAIPATTEELAITEESDSAEPAAVDADATQSVTTEASSATQSAATPQAEAASKTMVITDGAAQPVFSFTDPTSKGYTNANSEIWHFVVFVETDYDTDLDGKRDLVRVHVQVPRAAVLGSYQAPVVYKADPYAAAYQQNGSSFTFASSSIDEEQLKTKPAARVPTSEISTADFALSEAGFNASDWSYEVGNYPAEINSTMLDYYLERGFAVVYASGLGTYGSEGIECCGSVMERDALANVVEWLHGDRVAYTSTTGTTQIKARNGESGWSSGKVGMLGLSYPGAMCYEVATTGVEGLETIIPAAGPASWYDNSNSQGICADPYDNYNYTTVLADSCASRLFLKDDQRLLNLYQQYRVYLDECQVALRGDYGTYWQNRDWYTNQTGIKASALIVMGLNDENVRTKQFDLTRNAFLACGCEAKVLLHQNQHVWPVSEIDKTDIQIGDHTFMEWSNLWFTRELCDVENETSSLPAFTVQGNVDGTFYGTDRWDETDCVTIRPSGSGETTLQTKNSEITQSDLAENGLTESARNYAALWSLTLDEPYTIAGKIPVHLRIKANNLSEGDMPLSVVLVDRSADSFDAFCVTQAPGTEVVSKGDGSVSSYDVVTWKQEQTKYKIITDGRMDLRNPEAGYEPATATTRTESIEADTYYDYTLWLNPTYYTVAAGHTLELYVSGPYKSSYASYPLDFLKESLAKKGLRYSSQCKTGRDYSFTIQDDKSYATLPIAEEISYTVGSGDGATWSEGSSDTLSFTWNRSLNNAETYFHFTELMVDGETVDPANYTTAEGSLIANLSADYLQALGAGEHTVAAVFDDGTGAAATFTVDAAAADDSSSSTSSTASTTSAASTASTTSTTSTTTKRLLASTADATNAGVTVLTAAIGVLGAAALLRRKRSMNS